MRIYLINMPFFEQEYTKFTEKWEYVEDEYLGIGIVQAILQEKCDVIVGIQQSLDEMIQDALSSKADMIMISVMQTSARLTYEFICRIRKKGYLGKIFVGGWFAKMAWREIFNNAWSIDYVCVTNAEVSMKEWINDTEGDYPGIITYSNFSKYLKGERKIETDKSDWNVNYVTPIRKEGRNTYCIETSRGCPHSHCTFCSQSCGNQILDKWQPLPAEIIKDQIIEVHNLYGATRFATTDDDLLGPIDNALDRAREIRRLIKDLPFEISFSASISVKAASNGEILDCLQDVGLEQLCVGFESADKEQLKRYCKQQSLEDNFIAAHEIVSRNIRMLPGLITFDPFATPDTIRNNLDFLFNNLKHYDLSKLTKKLHILTGTPMKLMVERAGLLTGDYLYYDYFFQNKEVEDIYRSFQEYTGMVKPIQLKVNRAGMSRDEKIGLHHKKVADMILLGTEWKEEAIKEIAIIESMLKN